jgi:hypothetical protein
MESEVKMAVGKDSAMGGMGGWEEEDELVDARVREAAARAEARQIEARAAAIAEGEKQKGSREEAVGRRARAQANARENFAKFKAKEDGREKAEAGDSAPVSVTV